MIQALIDWQILQQIALWREQLHAQHKSSRPLSEGYEYIGLAGEAAFAELFGLPVDLTARPSGDNGVDFSTSAGTVDVKTYRKPYNLLLEVGKRHADILVLAGYDGEKARLIGWEYSRVLLACPVRDFGYGIRNHYKAAHSLRKLAELREIIHDRG